MHNESLEEIEKETERMCKKCEYFEKQDGVVICKATDHQFYTGNVPCNRMED